MLYNSWILYIIYICIMYRIVGGLEAINEFDFEFKELNLLILRSTMHSVFVFYVI